MSPFKDKELEQLSKQILDNAIYKQTPTQSPIQSPNLLVERLRQSITKRASLRIPKVY